MSYSLESEVLLAETQLCRMHDRTQLAFVHQYLKISLQRAFSLAGGWFASGYVLCGGWAVLKICIATGKS